MLRLSWGVLLGLLLNSGCAVLYKVQLSDMEYAPRGKPVSIKVSETTVDFGEAARLAGKLGAAAGSRGLQSVGRGADYYEAYFQFGPRTGTPVFNEFYARTVPELLSAECKSGYLSNITPVRESGEYSFIKGQIVRVDATCVQP